MEGGSKQDVKHPYTNQLCQELQDLKTVQSII